MYCRGYDSSSSTGVRRRATKGKKSNKDKQQTENAPAKSRKNSKRGKKSAPLDKEAAKLAAAVALQSQSPAPLPPPPSAKLVKYAGTTFGLASPLPESLPMPTAALLSGSPLMAKTPTPVLHQDATNALRGLLQLEVAAATSLVASSRLQSAGFHHSPATPVMV